MLNGALTLEHLAGLLCPSVFGLDIAVVGRCWHESLFDELGLRAHDWIPRTRKGNTK